MVEAPAGSGFDSDELLLHAVALVPAVRSTTPGWYKRQPGATPIIISCEEDVPDILLRLPASWNLVERAFFRGLHDDEDIVSVDPRFRHGLDRSAYAVVAHDDGKRFALLMLVNAVEAALMAHRPFRGERCFDACFGYVE
ncbi:MAG TPA: hypothetical protein VMJ11_12635 [Paraburkholderia sp.]|uniref:hypothetical protein n=1 Tax=Paraburkholderia sp. TaxID=1926495 RepID=UPI002C3F0624|nr:hypothetical protein [Paraburkholderia sp.]HTR07472.1 hypothetical protein [Paraburkholderia sp.]